MSAPALCREWWANLGARARAGVIFFPPLSHATPRVRVLLLTSLVYFLASHKAAGCLGFFLPTETDPCAVAFSFSSRDNFQLLRYCICTCNRITRVTVSLCITVHHRTLYQSVQYHPVSTYHRTLYQSVHCMYVSLCITVCITAQYHTVPTYHRTLYHCYSGGLHSAP